MRLLHEPWRLDERRDAADSGRAGARHRHRSGYGSRVVWPLTAAQIVAEQTRRCVLEQIARMLADVQQVRGSTTGSDHVSRAANSHAREISL